MIEGFLVTPMVRIDMRWGEIPGFFTRLYAFEDANDIVRYEGTTVSPTGMVAFYKPDDALKIVAFLKDKLPELSVGRFFWDRLDEAQKQEVLDQEKANG